MATKKRKRKPVLSRNAWLIPILGTALIGLVAALWMLFHPSGQGTGREGADDFGAAIRSIADRRGDSASNRREDDPIRKEAGMFVRSWRLEVPDRRTMEATCSDLEAEAVRWEASSVAANSVSDLEREVRIAFDVEVFEVTVAVVPQKREPTPTPTPAPTATPTPRPPPPPGATGRLAILLDDAGQKMDLIPRMAALDPRIAVAVLPFLPSSSETAVALHRAGHELWLHLPMEPMGYPDDQPGLGAVFVSMSEDEVRMTVRSALNNVPHVVGVNNHMGSRATADLRTMTWIMQEIKGRGMAFIDSRTTVKTVAETAARSQGIATGRRDVFLDNVRSTRAVRAQLDEAVYRSLIDGEAIAIGHLNEVTVSLLEQDLGTLGSRGVTLVPPTELLR